MIDAVRFEIDGMRAGEAEACQGLTFPAYRHLLALEPTLRHPSEPEQHRIQPVAVVARLDGRLLGLGLAELPLQAGDVPQLLSISVRSEYRRRGVATALVGAVEDLVAARGFDSMEAVYMTGRESIAALERILAARAWEPPALRSVSVKFTIEEALATPWYGRVRTPEGAEIFPWCELTAAERQRIAASNEEAPWIPDSLQPWRHDTHGFDAVSSVGLRYRGEVVGWVINHRVEERTVRFTCSFMRRDLSRRARILALYTESIRRLSETPCRSCTFITPTVYPEMVTFIRQHMAPYASFIGETRGTRKVLAGNARGATFPTPRVVAP